jgi:putative membrane protein
VNAIIRPLLVLITLPITILTLGLFTLVINALMFWTVSGLVEGFVVPDFWTAFWGALLYSLLTWMVSLALSDKDNTSGANRRRRAGAAAAARLAAHRTGIERTDQLAERRRRASMAIWKAPSSPYFLTENLTRLRRPSGKGHDATQNQRCFSSGRSRVSEAQ